MSSTKVKRRMEGVTIQIAGEDWIDPSSLMLFTEVGDRDVVSVIRSYREALEGYRAAFEATEKSNERRYEAEQAWKAAITKAVAGGLAPQRIFEVVGEISYMDNVYAGAISDAYFSLAGRHQADLVDEFRSRMDELSRWLEKRGGIEVEGARIALAAIGQDMK